MCNHEMCGVVALSVLRPTCDREVVLGILGRARASPRNNNVNNNNPLYYG